MEPTHILSALEKVLARYLAAWHENDPEVRRAHITAIWDSDGLFVDPTARVVGVEDLLAHITKFRQDFPGMTFELASGIELHHDVFRYRWHMRDKEGKERLRAFDVGQLSSEGRIARLIGFFGPFPALSSPS